MSINRNQFTGKAELYSKYRPDYPEQLIIDLIDEQSLNEKSVIADIGSGTGILTKKLLDSHLQVKAVEPNREMREIAENLLNDYEHFTSVNGTAENTTLASNSINLITVAQAFHWFDHKKFKNECKRILKFDGKVCIVFNMRSTDTTIIQEIIELYRSCCPNFKGFSNGISDTAFEEFFAGNGYKVNSYTNPLFYHRADFVGRHLSASYAPKKGEKTFELLVHGLNNLFDKYSEEGQIMIPNVTKSYCGYI